MGILISAPLEQRPAIALPVGHFMSYLGAADDLISICAHRPSVLYQVAGPAHAREIPFWTER